MPEDLESLTDKEIKNAYKIRDLHGDEEIYKLKNTYYIVKEINGTYQIRGKYNG